MELFHHPLALLALAALFVPLERRWPLRRAPWLREGWKTDVAHFFLTSPLQKLGLVLVVGVVVAVVDPYRDSLVQRQPKALQLVEALLLLELIGYAMHRAFHEVPALWRIHAVHHSSEHLDWLAAVRAHPLEQVLTRGAQLLALTALGFPLAMFAGAAGVLGLWAIFLHANVRLRLPLVEGLIATPAFHHWHHARAARGNYAGLFPWIDSLFHTNVTQPSWPSESGTDDPPAQSWWGQLTLRRPPRGEGRDRTAAG